MWQAVWRGIKWLLDWYGRFQAAPAVYALIAGVVVTIWGALAGAPGWALFLFFLSGCLILLGVLGLMQHWRQAHDRKDGSISAGDQSKVAWVPNLLL